MLNVSVILSIISVLIALVGFVLGWLLKSMQAQKKMANLVADYHNRIRKTVEITQHAKHQLEITKIKLQTSQDECHRLRKLLSENEIEDTHVINPDLLSLKNAKHKATDNKKQTLFAELIRKPGAFLGSISLSGLEKLTRLKYD